MIDFLSLFIQKPVLDLNTCCSNVEQCADGSKSEVSVGITNVTQNPRITKFTYFVSKSPILLQKLTKILQNPYKSYLFFTQNEQNTLNCEASSTGSYNDCLIVVCGADTQ